MTEFDYLKNMYWRLHEFECFLAKENRETPKRKDLVNESAVCATKCSIEDYLLEASKAALAARDAFEGASSYDAKRASLTAVRAVLKEPNI